MGARVHEPGARYRGTQPPETDRAHISRERLRLFTADVVDMDLMAAIFIGATKEIQPAEIGELIAAMNP